MKIKRILILMLVLLLISIQFIYADRYVEGVNHVHDTNSDGLISEKQLIELSMDLGLDFLFLTPHLPCVTGKCSSWYHLHPKNNFSQEYYKYEKTSANILRCAELNTNKDKAHILLLGGFDNIINDPEFANLSNGLTAVEITQFAKKHNLISVLAHPHDAHDPFALNDFDAIEFFNTKGYTTWNNHILQLKGEYWNAEKIDLDIYRQSILNFLHDPSNHKLIAVTGGCDAHFYESDLSSIGDSWLKRNMKKEELSFGHTLVRLPEKSLVTGNIVLEAIKSCKTYAVAYSKPGSKIKIENLNYHPQRDPYIVSSVNLTGVITLPQNSIKNNDNYLTIYKDGQKFWTQKVDSTSCNFIFKDNPSSGTHVYFLYIKGQLVTSPIVFEVEKLSSNHVYAENPQPTKTVKNFLQLVVIQDRNGALHCTDGSAQCVKLVDDFMSCLTGWPVTSPATFEMIRILEDPKVTLEKIVSSKATVTVDCTFAFMGGHLATKEITKEKYSFSLVNRSGAWIIISGRTVSSTSMGYRDMNTLPIWSYAKQKCQPLYETNYAKLIAELKSRNKNRSSERNSGKKLATRPKKGADFYRQLIGKTDQEKWDSVCRDLMFGRISADSIDSNFIEKRKGGQEAILDKRILTMLYILNLTHKNLQLKIISGYETQEKGYIKYPNGESFFSSHYFGMAIDIFQVDGVYLSWQNNSDPLKRRRAKEKIHELVDEILYISSLDKEYLPTQLIVQEVEDVRPFWPERDRLYGNGSPGSAEKNIETGCRMGFSYNPEEQGRIHIGY